MRLSFPARLHPAEHPESDRESRTRETLMSGGCGSAPLRAQRPRPGPRVRGQDESARADARLERNQTDTARPAVPALEEDLLSGSGWPLLKYSLPLTRN